MKILVTLFLASAVAMASAAEPEQKQPFRQRLIERFDKDGDGKLSADERRTARDRFAKSKRSKDSSGPSAISPDKTDLYKLADGPLEISVAPTLELRDQQQDKTLPLRVTFPTSAGKYPVIVFSHGAMGSKDGYEPLIQYWASHGYVCIQPTHGDSLSLLSQDEKRKITSLRGRLNDQATLSHWRTRPQDVRLVLDNLTDIESRLKDFDGKLDKKRIGIGGHSFGAHTSQMIAGLALKTPLSSRKIQMTDERPRAFLLISPQGTGQAVQKDSWQEIGRPAMVITGSNDNSVRNGKSYQWRLEVYENMPPKNKYLVFIQDAYHGFGGIVGPVRFPSSGPANPDHVYCVKSTSLAFWDAYLKKDEAAREFLESDRLQRVTEGAAKLSHK